MTDTKDDHIRAMWAEARTAEIAQATGLSERTVRWRAARLGLPVHPRGRRKTLFVAVAERPEVRPATLPISATTPITQRVKLPQDYEAFRPGTAPQPPVCRS